MRRALARVTNAEAAEEVLAQYFLEARQELLVELLDALGVKHEDGRLEEPVSPPPTAAKLKKTVAKFQKGQERDKRDLLLRAFASQSAIDWPELDALLA
jgi:thermostable 8-oxoguanine DNA glycosylase